MITRICMNNRWLLIAFVAFSPFAVAEPSTRIALDNPVIVVGSDEPSYVRYGANDAAAYLREITGNQVKILDSTRDIGRATSIVVIGMSAAQALHVEPENVNSIGDEGYVIHTAHLGKRELIVVAGSDPHGTNAGIASLMRLIQGERHSAYLAGPHDVRSKPSIAVRGIQLNGWPLNYPYAFRSWKEADWKRFVDIAWVQHVNLFYLWPFMEIIPVPLSQEDEAYLQEVQRVVEYARKQRGMEVWIMQSANRIAVSDCKVKDPRFRTYWVMGECQKDMNPADPEQFAQILAHFEVLYKIVNNADGFCFIDSDPGGWPGSPLSDQVKVFNGARKLLDRYSLHGSKTKLIDWMWLGWGRHPSGDESGARAVDFMAETIRNFKTNLPEPWDLIAGISSYLQSAQRESVLDKTVFLQYGAIEMEPAFPSTNLNLDPVQDVFDVAAKYPALKGIMGNNELMSLQFPRTFYFFNRAWDAAYKDRSEPQVLAELARQLYPDHQQLIVAAFQKLRAENPGEIEPTLEELSKLIQSGNMGRKGAIGRYLFPEHLAVAKNLEMQLGIRDARQRFIQAMNRDEKPSVQESAHLLEDYFDKLLAWNHETGWEKMIDITIWNAPIYEKDHALSKAMGNLRQVLAQGKPYTSYTQIADFFDGISEHLLHEYGRDSVMIGCIEPFKMSVIEGR